MSQERLMTEELFCGICRTDSSGCHTGTIAVALIGRQRSYRYREC